MTANSRKNRENVVGEHVEIVVAHRSVVGHWNSQILVVNPISTRSFDYKGA